MARGSDGRTRTPVLDPALRRIATVVVLGAIMSILDTTIVAVALDTLGRDFHVPISTIQWVSTGYLLALAVVIPITGWAIDRFGAKPTWLLSLGLFVVGSSLCGLSWSATSLIVFRIAQGLGGGMILPIGQAVLARAAGPQRMGRVMSVIGVPTVLGPVLGPVLGGLIVSNFSWRWIFYVNVPIGIVAIVLSWRWLETSDTRVRTNFDALGFLLLSPVSPCSSTPSPRSELPEASRALRCWPASRRGRSCASSSACEPFTPEFPLLDLRLFRFRSFTVANICVFLFGATLFGSMFLLPLYYQVVRGQSALVAGLLLAPQGIGAALVMRGAGAITDRSGPRRIVPIGIAIMALSTLPFAFVTTSTSEVLLGLTLFVRGMGLGLSMMPIIAASYADLSVEAVPRATTTVNIVRQIGGSFATALFAVILQRQLADTSSGGATPLSGTSTAKLPPTVDDTVAHAFAHTFWWAVAIVTVSIIPALFLPALRKGVVTGTGAASPAAAEAGATGPRPELAEVPAPVADIGS